MQGRDSLIALPYNRAQRLPEGRTMMHAWADYLDRLRDDRTSEKASMDPPPHTDGEPTPPEEIIDIQVPYNLVLNGSKLYHHV